MSGYIASLLQRAVSGSEIRPRALQPFEPALTELYAEAPVTAAAVVPPSPAHERAMESEPRPESHPQPQREESRVDLVEVVRERVVKRTVDGTVVVPAATFVPHVTASITPPREVHAPLTASSSAAPPVTPPPLSPPVPPHAAPSVASPRVVTSWVKAAADPALLHATAPEQPTLERHTHLTQRETRVLARVPIPTRPAPPHVIDNDTSASEPTVHITIGRVDVRAIAPPTPVQARPVEKPPKPQLTLDEYLRGRGSQ